LNLTTARVTYLTTETSKLSKQLNSGVFYPTTSDVVVGNKDEKELTKMEQQEYIQTKLKEYYHERVAMMKRQAEAGNDLFIALIGNTDKQREVGLSVIHTLDNLYALLGKHEYNIHTQT
jgi:hypothetical protein